MADLDDVVKFSRVTWFPGKSLLVGLSQIRGIQQAQKDIISLPSRDRIAPGNRILWSEQITLSIKFIIIIIDELL